jgi:hypothetical protein
VEAMEEAEAANAAGASSMEQRLQAQLEHLARMVASVKDDTEHTRKVVDDISERLESVRKQVSVSRKLLQMGIEGKPKGCPSIYMLYDQNPDSAGAASGAGGGGGGGMKRVKGAMRRVSNVMQDTMYLQLLCAHTLEPVKGACYEIKDAKQWVKKHAVSLKLAAFVLKGVIGSALTLFPAAGGLVSAAGDAVGSAFDFDSSSVIFDFDAMMDSADEALEGALEGASGSLVAAPGAALSNALASAKSNTLSKLSDGERQKVQQVVGPALDKFKAFLAEQKGSNVEEGRFGKGPGQLVRAMRERDEAIEVDFVLEENKEAWQNWEAAASGAPSPSGAGGKQGAGSDTAGDETAAQSGGSASRAAAGCGELKAGWLHKYSIRSAFAKNWKKRWFIVGRDHISYFEKNPETYTGKSQAIAKGAVALQGASLLPDVPGKRAFMFQLTYQPSAAASETVMVLAADSDAERQQWVGAIETALANA